MPRPEDIERFNSLYGVKPDQSEAVFGGVPLPPPVEGPMYNDPGAGVTPGRHEATGPGALAIDLESPQAFRSDAAPAVNLTPTGEGQWKRPEGMMFDPDPSKWKRPAGFVPDAVPGVRQPIATHVDTPQEKAAMMQPPKRATVPNAGEQQDPWMARAYARHGIQPGDIKTQAELDNKTNLLQQDQLAIANQGMEAQARLLDHRAQLEEANATAAKQRNEAVEADYQQRMGNVQKLADEKPPPPEFGKGLMMALSFAAGTFSDAANARAGIHGNAVDALVANQQAQDERIYRQKMDKLSGMRVDANQRANMAQRFADEKKAADFGSLQAVDSAIKAQMAKTAVDGSPAQMAALKQLQDQTVFAKQTQLQQSLRAEAWADKNTPHGGPATMKSQDVKDFVPDGGTDAYGRPTGIFTYRGGDAEKTAEQIQNAQKLVEKGEEIKRLRASMDGVEMLAKKAVSPLGASADIARLNQLEREYGILKGAQAYGGKMPRGVDPDKFVQGSASGVLFGGKAFEAGLDADKKEQQRLLERARSVVGTPGVLGIDPRTGQRVGALSGLESTRNARIAPVEVAPVPMATRKAKSEAEDDEE